MLRCFALLVLVCVASANHQWGNYRMPCQNNALVVKIADCHSTGTFSLPRNPGDSSQITTTWSALLAEVVARWNSIPNIPEGYVSGGQALPFPWNSASTSPAKASFEVVPCDTSGAQVESFDRDLGANSGYLGYAQVRTYKRPKGVISSAISVMNTGYIGVDYEFSSIRGLQHVLCQEIGHTFGLDHQSESGADWNSCMDYSRDLDNPYPNVHDRELLDQMYCGDGGDSGGSKGRGKKKGKAKVPKGNAKKDDDDWGHYEGHFHWEKKVGNSIILTTATPVEPEEDSHEGHEEPHAHVTTQAVDPIEEETN
eukprot:TRINITY_DN85333_c0_g1_i1.p1 TRINITY_DN85333_c0_g1~~TRINITY_DN85333_c0_g1_i1.p1  ORF type:complete len:311 (-),score=26.59 TRINITY_DN85333_c0_g1_i1:146-1078(-)